MRGVKKIPRGKFLKRRVGWVSYAKGKDNYSHYRKYTNISIQQAEQGPGIDILTVSSTRKTKNRIELEYVDYQNPPCDYPGRERSRCPCSFRGSLSPSPSSRAVLPTSTRTDVHNVRHL